MSELQTIDIATIDIPAGENPRGNVDVDSLEPLIGSIGRHGVLQPIIVSPGTDGEHVLVAGERRLRAARIAGLTEIPAVVRDLNGDSFSVALVENMQREQLSPIEEARAFQRAIAGGMSETELAEAVSLSQATIRDRLALLALPGPVQAKVDTREVTLSTAKALQTFAAAGEVVVEKVVELLDEDESFYREPVLPRDLETDPAWVLEQALDELDRDKKTPRPFVVDPDGGGYRGIVIDDLPWPDDVDVKALKEKAKQLPEHDGSYRQIRGAALKFTGDDYDAAGAYGCLLQLPSKNDHKGFITDPVWLADRLTQKLDVAIAKQQKKTPKSTAAGDVADKEKQRRDADRKERQKKQAKQLDSRERNLRLGRELFKQLHRPEITVDGMRAIAELLVVYAGEDLGRCGLRFVDEDTQTVTLRKDQTISRVTYVKTTTELRELVAAKVGKAETPEEIYGVLLQLILAAAHASREAAAESDRSGEVRGVTRDSSYYATKPLTGALETLTGAFVPDDIRKKTGGRRA